MPSFQNIAILANKTDPGSKMINLGSFVRRRQAWSCWKNAGRPLTGELHEAKTEAKKKVRKRLKARKDRIRVLMINSETK